MSLAAAMDEPVTPPTGSTASRPVGRPWVLVVDSDIRFRRLEAAVLQDEGYNVETVKNPRAARNRLRLRPVDAVVIDPASEDGLDLVHDLRLLTEAPIIVVHQSDVEADKVRHLDAGADDYLTKPFGTDELLARLRAVRRRTVARVDVPPLTTPDFTVNFANRRCQLIDGTDVLLTPTEWRLVEILARRPGRLATQAAVLKEVWGASASDKAPSLRVYMSTIRHKLEPDPAHPRYFVTVPGVGVRFVSNAAP